MKLSSPHLLLSWHHSCCPYHSYGSSCPSPRLGSRPLSSLVSDYLHPSYSASRPTPWFLSRSFPSLHLRDPPLGNRSQPPWVPSWSLLPPALAAVHHLPLPPWLLPWTLPFPPLPGIWLRPPSFDLITLLQPLLSRPLFSYQQTQVIYCHANIYIYICTFLLIVFLD